MTVQPTHRNDSTGTVYVNGKVVTVDQRFSTAEALTVHRGRFGAVGTTAEVLAAAPAANVVDLGGRMVLPGFIDTHAHTVFRALGTLATPSLRGACSIREIIARIQAVARHQPAGSWITTSPLGEPPDYFGLPEAIGGQWPTRRDLDAAAPDHLVYVPTPIYWPHPAIYNSRALTALEVTADTPDEPGIRIDRERSTDEPTGLIYGLHPYNRGSRLFGRLTAMVPQSSPSGDRHAAIRAAMHENLNVGVTTIYEGHANFSTPDLLALRADRQLPHRVACSEEVPHWLPPDELKQWMAGQAATAGGSGTGDDLLKIVGVTVSLDGAIQFGAAHMRQPYLDPHGVSGNGRSALSVDQLAGIARLALTYNLQLGVLAAGDAAGDLAVEALRIVHAQTPLNGRNWLVQHFQHPSRRQIAELHAMDLNAQTHASVDYSKGAEVYLKRLGGARWRDVVPLRWWLDAGVTVASGSDGAHYDPMFQMWESLQRVDGRTGCSLNTPAKAITRQEAIRLQTINGAQLLGWATRLGSIETGKLADFVVVDRNILSCPVDEIRNATVTLTILNGDVVAQHR